MKTFTIILHFCIFGVLTLSASNTPTPKATAATTTYNVEMDEHGIGARTLYIESQDHLEFDTQEVIDMVQIFDIQGNLQFQLPVLSNQIRIGKSLFDKGEYKLGFLLSNQNSLEFAKVKVL